MDDHPPSYFSYQCCESLQYFLQTYIFLAFLVIIMTITSLYCFTYIKTYCNAVAISDIYCDCHKNTASVKIVGKLITNVSSVDSFKLNTIELHRT